MKRSIISLVLFFAFSSLANSVSSTGFASLLPEAMVTMEFSFQLSYSEGYINFELIPTTPGREGDGFIISTEKGSYFLPEGKKLCLRSTKRYKLFAARAFRSTRGIILGDSKYLTTLNRQRLCGDINLERFTLESELLLTPHVGVDWDNHRYSISFGYMSPPQYPDYNFLAFHPHPRSGITEMLYRKNRTGHFRIPDQYMAAFVYFAIEDAGRTILSSPNSTYD